MVASPTGEGRGRPEASQTQSCVRVSAEGGEGAVRSRERDPHEETIRLGGIFSATKK